ncbi:Sodium/hydrogen exchanger family protein [Apiospora hydei]|uniref:Sodium/hydrogen exchanger family protein n=1 Tax=Apiospora hydei TaxID=1337664 RepID=A0ABR1WNE8_9PEZI
MATTTVTTVLTTTARAASSAASPTSTNRATPQGGILEGVLPNEYNASDPIKLFIIQAGIIIILCHLLHYPLSRFGQPRVIAEVLGGILLGPSVLSRIHGFRDALFPTASMPVLNNAANLGLVLFLFLIALEVDIRLFTANWRVALAVGLAGMVLPFGLGCAVAWGLYHQFHSTDGTVVPINFGVYALFIGTALAITAFPVLCRILSELNLLRTPVGVTVLAAGVGNDVVGWILLALCVALVNSSSGVAALYVLLVAVGWVLVLVFAVKPVFHWILRRTGSIQNGPTQGMVGLTILLVLTSAWFTGIIGVHPIFGGFLVGLICPHDGGFAIKLTEKIEDLVTVLFLPLYFALSGLNTDLGLLNDGLAWAYVVAVCAIAFAGKIIGGTLAAKANQLVWRESLTIGCLMSCKGLVELIVLADGVATLEYWIAGQDPLADHFHYLRGHGSDNHGCHDATNEMVVPPWYQKKLEQWKRGEIDWSGTPLNGPEDAHGNEILGSAQKLQDTSIRRLLVYLRIDSLPSIFTFISLLGEETEEGAVVKAPSDSLTAPDEQTTKAAITKKEKRKRPLEVHGLRILELTDRTSSVMKVTESDEFTRRDPVVNTFKTFSQLHDVAVSGSVVVAPEDAYAQTVTSQAATQESDFVLIPWSEAGGYGGKHTDDESVPLVKAMSSPPQDRFAERSHHEFLQGVLSSAVCDVGIFISNGFSSSAITHSPAGLIEKAEASGSSRSISGFSQRSRKEAAQPPVADKSHHVFLPFLSGVDDRGALRFVLQLARSPHVTATIAQLHWESAAAVDDDDNDEITTADSTVGDDKRTVDNGVTAMDSSMLTAVRGSLPATAVSRIRFVDVTVSSNGSAVESALGLARETVGQNTRNAGDIIVVGRRHPGLKKHHISSSSSSSRAAATAAGGGAASSSGTTNHGPENQDMGRTVGYLGEKMSLGGLQASVLVIQAAGSGLDGNAHR